MLLEFATELGLSPRRVSSTKGGEYHSACPSCGGKDRFIIWAQQGRYWCRQCQNSGDIIKFQREFCGKSFIEAKSRVGNYDPFYSAKPIVHSMPWREKGMAFIKSSQDRLLIDSKALALVQSRGLTLDTLKRYRLGWNPTPTFDLRENWGLEKIAFEGDKEKKLFIPQGIVIPCYQENGLYKIKIRRSDWQEGSPFGKYYIVPGSEDHLPIFGDLQSSIAVLVEAEFDAMLVVQETGSSYAVVALGGAQKRPSAMLSMWLYEKQLVLFAADYDMAGIQAMAYWSIYPNLRPWPVPNEKSPGDYFMAKGNIKIWLELGVDHYLKGGMIRDLK